MDFYRKIERSVTISADKRSTVDLQVDIWSQDLNVTKFVLKLDTADSTPIDLTNAAVRVAIVYNQDGQDVKIEAAGIVEDVATQKIAYVMSDKLAGFEGEVTAGFYVTLKTGQRIDVQNVTFNMRKSLLDKDLEAATENYYQTFDDIAKDVRNQADTQKSAMLAKTNEVTSYGDTQKTAMNNIVKDVQSTGNTAKTQINQVLPSVQSKVAAINTELSKIDENMPDLFVAYADNNSGGGFSRTDSAKLFKGYGIKNSNSPTDYRWERNVDNLQIGGRNLYVQSANNTFSGDVSKQSNTNKVLKKYGFESKSIYDTKPAGLSNVRLQQLQFNGITYATVSFDAYVNTGSLDLRVDICDLGNKSYEISATKTRYSLFVNNINKLNTPDTYNGFVDFAFTLAGGQTLYVEYIMVEHATTPSNQVPAIEDMFLESNPINSVLTTLSQENPSTTLGGTWTQLGTESKFGSTIYYWKRTN